MTIARGTAGSVPPALPPAPRFFQRLFPLPVRRSPWEIQHTSSMSIILGFSTQSTASHSGLSEPLFKGCPAVHYLDSATLLDHGRRSCDPVLHASFVYLKAAPLGQHCRVWLPAWDGDWSPRIIYVSFHLLFLFRRRKCPQPFLSQMGAQLGRILV